MLVLPEAALIMSLQLSTFFAQVVKPRGWYRGMSSAPTIPSSPSGPAAAHSPAERTQQHTEPP